MKHIVAQNHNTHWRITSVSFNAPEDRAISFARCRLNSSGHGMETIALEVTEDFTISNVTPERMAKIIAGSKVLGSFPAVWSDAA
jgi:hypothetical protein